MPGVLGLPDDFVFHGYSLRTRMLISYTVVNGRCNDDERQHLVDFLFIKYAVIVLMTFHMIGDTNMAFRSSFLER